MTDHPLLVARIYDDASATDGRRILVDRLWPRGVSKDDADLDLWAKDVAPSDSLRRWYDHDVDRFDEFARRYREELGQPDQHEHVTDLVRHLRDDPVVLLTATRDVEHSHVPILADIIRSARTTLTEEE